MADGFLGRWSRRKLDVQEGKPVPPEPPVAAGSPAAVPGAAAVSGAAALAPGAATAPAAQPQGPAVQPKRPPEPPPPTLEDVRALTRDSDFSAFTRPGVDPEVRNAAMKKLFSDPHYNVMDGLDIYIDDYSKPDPIPAAMLRQLASAQFLDLFSEREKEAAPTDPGGVGTAAAETEGPGAAVDPSPPREVADDPTAQTVAQSGSSGLAGLPEERRPPDHANPDLRLQQDDAPAGKAARGGAE